ncbi:biotin carboxyl carrier protein of acetyl-CoA carboxylase-like [Mangifera indica]|uniref:biotin carboxyl carrier protein of acetyl-CoA carboxylase-like n=1 Tax=Mangifera indica TaxID=29780 RepID=UPI001CFA231E|nr:biotin carboxyl carrier protein of acetyl-CoA carboxylase-like [Mangifera indica]
MESSATLRSFNYSIGTIPHVGSLLERPGMVSVQSSCWHGLSKFHKLIASPVKRYRTVVSGAKTSEATVAAKSEVSSGSATQSSLEKNTLRNATFPSAVEALVLEVCDETEVAELKLKVGDFEMHMKRNVGATKVPMSNISPTTAPPIPSKPMDVSAPAATPPAPKPSKEKTSPFANVSFGKSPKLVAFEASGPNGYVLVSSPTVGSFRRNRTVKGKKQPPICKEGDVIKEGQIIGYLDQFGTELPVKSDVAGEVLKLLFNDGEAVGYGDPLVAVLPSFHGIE